MSKDHPEDTKLYYSIGEVARMFSVNPSLIRFWEKKFEVIRPKKNNKGRRLFTPKDIDYFHAIHHLVKEKGYTLKGAEEMIRNNGEETLKEIEIIKTLDKMRDFLISVREKM